MLYTSYHPEIPIPFIHPTPPIQVLPHSATSILDGIFNTRDLTKILQLTWALTKEPVGCKSLSGPTAVLPQQEGILSTCKTLCLFLFSQEFVIFTCLSHGVVLSMVDFCFIRPCNFASQAIPLGNLETTSSTSMLSLDR